MTSRNDLARVIAAILVISFFAFLYRGLFIECMFSFGDLRAFTSSWYSVERYVLAWQPEGLGNSEARPIGEFILGALLLLTDKGWLVQRLALLALLPLSLLTMWKFLGLVTESMVGRLIGSFLYSVNPLTLQEFSNGSIGLLTVYAALPIITSSFIISIVSGRKRGYFSFGLSVSIASIFYPHTSLFIALPIVLVFAFVYAVRSSKRLIITRRIFYALLAGMSMYFLLLLPSAIGLIQDYLVSAPALPSLIGADVHYTYSESSLINLARLLGVAWSGTTLNTLGYLGLSMFGLSTLIIPLFAFSGAGLVIYQRKIENPIGLGCITLTVCVIAFAQLTEVGLTIFAFENIPLMAQYRSPVKLVYILSFAYAPLIAVTGSQIERLCGFTRARVASRAHLSRTLAALFILAIVGTGTVIGILPFLDGTLALEKTRGSEIYLPERYVYLGRTFGKLRNSVGFFRVLWLPLDYENSIRIGAVDEYAFMMPGGAELRGQRYSSLDFFERALCAIANGKLGEGAKLLGLANVKYVAIDKLSNWNGGPQMLGSYYLVGEPHELEHAFNESVQFKRLGNWFDFVIMENEEFVPHLETFDIATAIDFGGQLKTSQNMLLNGAFEEGLHGWVSHPKENVIVDSSASREGRFSAKLVAPCKGEPSLIFQRIPAISGVVYNMSAWIRVLNFNGLHIKLVWYRNPDDNQSVPLRADYKWLDENSGGKWQHIDLAAEAPINATTLEVVFLVTPASDISSVNELWVDNVTLTSLNDLANTDYWTIIDQVSDVPGLSLQRSVYLNRCDYQSLGTNPDVFASIGLRSIFEPEPENTYVEILLPELNLQPINGQWFKMPGSLGRVQAGLNATAILSFSVVQEAYYSLYLDAVPANALNIEALSTGADRLHVDILYLKPGDYSFKISSLNSEVLLENIALLSSSNQNELSEMINNEGKRAKYLLFFDSFDEEWSAGNDDVELDHFKYFWLNGYLLEGAPTISISIEYQGQKLRNFLVFLQWLGWIVACGFLILSWIIETFKTNFEIQIFSRLRKSLLRCFPPYTEDLWIWQNRARLIKAKTNSFDDTKKKFILDLGCAEGGFITQFAQQLQTESEVIGIDVSPKFFSTIKEKDRLRFIFADAANLPFKTNAFDIVMTKDLLHHVNSPRRVIDESLRVSKRDASLVIVEANRENVVMRLFQKYGRHQHLRLHQIQGWLHERQVRVSTCVVEAHPYYPFFNPAGHGITAAAIMIWNIIWLILYVLFSRLRPLVRFALAFEDVFGRIQGSGASFNILVVRR